jgi:hypothetical protein
VCLRAFRFQRPQGCGGSTPPFRTTKATSMRWPFLLGLLLGEAPFQ